MDWQACRHLFRQGRHGEVAFERSVSQAHASLPLLPPVQAPPPLLFLIASFPARNRRSSAPRHLAPNLHWGTWPLGVSRTGPWPSYAGGNNPIRGFIANICVACSSSLEVSKASGRRVSAVFATTLQDVRHVACCRRRHHPRTCRLRATGWVSSLKRVNRTPGVVVGRCLLHGHLRSILPHSSAKVALGSRLGRGVSSGAASCVCCRSCGLRHFVECLLLRLPWASIVVSAASAPAHSSRSLPPSPLRPGAKGAEGLRLEPVQRAIAVGHAAACAIDCIAERGRGRGVSLSPAWQALAHYEARNVGARMRRARELRVRYRSTRLFSLLVCVSVCVLCEPLRRKAKSRPNIGALRARSRTMLHGSRSDVTVRADGARVAPAEADHTC